jgi:hypothetical protein
MASQILPKPLSLPRQYPLEYSIWAGMKQRCTNRKCKEFRYYGQRGIRVCRRWSGKNGFRHFIEDMGPQPFKRASVHRKDNDGNYTPKNVVWANPKTQARHMRTNRILEFQGQKKILIEWAEHFGIKPGTLGARLAKGWPVEKALTTPVKPWRGRTQPGCVKLCPGRTGNRSSCTIAASCAGHGRP